jgi:hypothetical protein
VLEFIVAGVPSSARLKHSGGRDTRLTPLLQTRQHERLARIAGFAGSHFAAVFHPVLMPVCQAFEALTVERT